ncbi:efflux RND transporter periplasmic adaptor subunit [Vibrio maerlii]|uniref:efflux RND transporter periplasmic adaptor subunit n=1 Tax=Vibrio maerlii TaxID=2231648 RepID=UPI000E3C716F|nr:efflux RND transporter periplasmic adaptor subunit [Vibrio maerlii]
MNKSLKKNAITFAITAAAAGSIFAVIAFNGSQIAQANQVKKGAPAEAGQQVEQVLPQVEVQNTQAGSYQAQVVGYGETKPRFELAYAAEVSGRVEWLSDAFEAGKTVKQGELLAKLDATSYEQAVASAAYDLATAKQELLEEQRQGEQARSEWQRSGLSGEPNSPLVLREPQLASAKAKLENAQKALEKAQNDLEKTEIRAPFDGVVVSRDIQPGSYLNAGSNLATLYSIDRIEIEIPLSDSQWSNLPKQSKSVEWTATITDSTGAHQWDAEIERSYQFVAQDTRQRSIVLVVDNPLEQAEPLFPGTFIQATIEGTEVDNLWQLPSSALSQQGEIWMVDAQGLLAKTSAAKVFERQGYIYVEPTEEAGSTQVVMRPLSNFKVGMKVDAKTSEPSKAIAVNSTNTQSEEG